ncbi:MAG: hypothetical protein GXP18_03615 [Gammaproteobacteria bacterium]|nr:hypothetical protein [Gammaproteobacteria bacterium]
MSNNKSMILLSIAGILTSLPMLTSAETVFEEVRVVYDGGGQDHLNAAAVDVDGNMYITGVRGQSAGINAAYYTAKYDSYGREEWLRIYAPGGTSAGGKMTIDRDGNSYIALTAPLGRILKYDTDGNESILVADPNITPYGCCSGEVGLVLDKDENNLYTWVSHTIQKVSLNGGTNWAQQLHAASYLVRDIAVDDAGDIYVVGQSLSIATELVIKKFDSLGNVIWSQFWSEDGMQSEYTYGLELDSNNNVYILAQVVSYENSCLYCVTSSIINFSSDGNFVNSVILGGEDEYVAGSIKIVDDKIYVVVRKRTGPTMVTQKRNTDLSLIWSAEHAVGYIVPRNSPDIDGLGNVIVGYDGLDAKMSTVKYDMNGNELWTMKGEGRRSVFVKFGASSDIYTAGSAGLIPDTFMYRYDVTSLICQ